MNRRFKAILLLTAAVFLFAACSPAPVDEEVRNLNDRITTLEEQISRMEEENTNLRLEIETLTEERDTYKAALDALEGAETEEPLTVAFTLHGGTGQGEPQVVGTVEIPMEFSLEQRLQYLGDALTEEVFPGLSMEFTGFQTMEGRTVAVLDLIEPENQAVGDPSWIYNYFQGSTGGMITTNALVETFLQRDFDGDWIEGVYFTLNGESIQFEHVVGLDEPYFR